MTDMVTVFKEVRFEAAHKLNGLERGHKCGRLHGHSYMVRLEVRGPVDSLGMVIDYADLKDAWEERCGELDHSYLNEVMCGIQTTSENLAIWIWDRMDSHSVRLSAVEVRETCTAGSRYEGPA